MGRWNLLATFLLMATVSCTAEIGDPENPLAPDDDIVGQAEGDGDDTPPIEQDPDPGPPPAACTEGDARILAADGQCYALFQTKKSWAASRLSCQNLGGDLATITSADEQTLLNPLINQGRDGNNDELWIGANDIAVEGTYAWNSGAEAFVYTFWRPNQPSGGAEDCVVTDLDDDNRWDDRNCSATAGYICERLSQSPN